MDNMIDDILGQISADALAGSLGTDTETAMTAARQALPALLGGLTANAQSQDGLSSLSRALQKDHDGSLLDIQNPLERVDPTDGEKILGHVFGDRRETVERQLGGTGAGGQSLFSKLLPMLAPLVMAWLGKKLGGGAGLDPSGGGRRPPSGGGLGLDDLLGGMLGQQTSQAQQQMPDLGGLFEMILGGAGGAGRGAPQQSSRRRDGDVPDIGDLLGG